MGDILPFFYALPRFKKIFHNYIKNKNEVKMIIGIVKEQIAEENRVAITPQIAELLIKDGFEIIIEQNAGKNAGFDDDSYHQKSVKINPTANEVFSSAITLKWKFKF